MPTAALSKSFNLLQIFSWGIDDVWHFLEQAPDPPTREAFDMAVADLQDLGALDGDAKPTALGWTLQTIPISPRLGRMLLLACLLGCLGPVLTVAAALSYR